MTSSAVLSLFIYFQSSITGFFKADFKAAAEDSKAAVLSSAHTVSSEQYHTVRKQIGAQLKFQWIGIDFDSPRKSPIRALAESIILFTMYPVF